LSSFTQEASPRRSIDNLVAAAGDVWRDDWNQWQDHIDEFYAAGFALMIDGMVVMLGVMVAVSDARVARSVFNPAAGPVHDVFMGNERALGDVLEACETDPKQPARWRMVFDPERLSDPANKAFFDRLVCLAPDDVWPVADVMDKARVRLSDRLVGALMAEALDTARSV
jgi:hypothetical protein